MSRIPLSETGTHLTANASRFLFLFVLLPAYFMRGIHVQIFFPCQQFTDE